MNTNSVRTSSVGKWGKVVSIVMLLILAASLLPMAAAPLPSLQSVSAKIHPMLLDLAARQPDGKVAVMVQTVARDGSAEALVARLGGAVTKDLRIISAFAARLPAKAVTQLASAPSVRWITPDGPMVSTGSSGPSTVAANNYYLDTLGVRPLWDRGLRGQGIGVAVIDSGVSTDADFSNLVQISFSSNSQTVEDEYGHGTHVAGIIAGNGNDAAGRFSGIAPEVTLISVKASDENGQAFESDTVRALQWVLEHKTQYNIRVINLSINSTDEQSYHTSPLDAAVEILWFNGVVVVASAGNKGLPGKYSTIGAAPANDPFIITVGAADEGKTADRTDDAVALYSSVGLTRDGFPKPEIFAPGGSIYSVLSQDSEWARRMPSRTTLNGQYFRLSGTSMAAPMVTGAVALLLQDQPQLTPDQVKYRLIQTASTLTVNIGPARVSYPYLDIHAAVTGTTDQTSNTGVQASQMLWTGPEPVNWASVNWTSTNWNSVNWTSVNWTSVNWTSMEGNIFWDNETRVYMPAITR